MRLIDADEVMDILPEENVDARMAVLFAPTVDPVKHGRWMHGVDTGADMLKCSECSCRVVLKWYKIAVGTAGYEFCPYCGAKMDEEG